MDPAPEVLAALIRRLVAAGCVAADDEAHRLAASAADSDSLDALVSRREVGEPFAWLVGSTTFCGATLLIEPGVYVPRPQSEQLARRAAALLPGDGAAVDLCTGAGAIAVHLRNCRPGAVVVGIDRDVVAVRCARRNGVAAAVGDLGGACRSGQFDVVTAVAPYVPTDAIAVLPADVRRHEPRLALHGGSDGLDVVRRVVASAAELLRPGGWLLIEIGGDQDVLIAPVLARAGFDEVDPWYDDDGDLRGVATRIRRT